MTMAHKFPRGKNRKLTLQLKGQLDEFPLALRTPDDRAVSICGKIYVIERRLSRYRAENHNAWMELTLIPWDDYVKKTRKGE